jgi:hypothetical protein
VIVILNVGEKEVGDQDRIEIEEELGERTFSGLLFLQRSNRNFPILRGRTGRPFSRSFNSISPPWTG